MSCDGRNVSTGTDTVHLAVYLQNSFKNQRQCRLYQHQLY